MEKFTGDKYPNCVKDLLTLVAYDTIHSLNEINQQRLEEIEQFLTSQKEFIQKLNCCRSDYYKSLEVFKFLPGHATIILALPDQINQMENAKGAKQLEFKKKKSDQELKENLVENLMTYSAKLGFQFPKGVINERNIQQFERNADASADNYICKCIFSCPFCPKTISTKFIKYWISGNITAHLKKHIYENFEGLNESNADPRVQVEPCVQH